MTNITITPRSIVLNGHAGDKVVCAALSGLTETFLASIEELTEDLVFKWVLDGYARIEHKDLTAEADLLRRSFLIGLQRIANGYPENVTIQTER